MTDPLTRSEAQAALKRAAEYWEDWHENNRDLVRSIVLLDTPALVATLDKAMELLERLNHEADALRNAVSMTPDGHKDLGRCLDKADALLTHWNKKEDT
jgi:DNA-binding MarR family transcriptional regulator